MRKTWVEIVVAVGLFTGIGLVTAGPAGSAAGPQLSVPATATAGDAIDVVVTACSGSATTRWYLSGDQASPTEITMVAGPGAGEHHGSFVAPDADVYVRAECNGTPFFTEGVGQVDVATTTTPTAVLGPEHPSPGDQVTLTVTGCATEPEGSTSYSDVVVGVIFAAGGPETWVASTTVGSEDQTFSASCIGWIGVRGLIADVENPVLLWGPFSPGFGYYGPHTSLTGTDCPDGALPEVTFTGGGQEWSITDDHTDEQGDWAMDLPDFSALPPETLVTASATCGSVTYEPIEDVFGETTATTSPATTTTTPTAPPANALPGTANFTG